MTDLSDLSITEAAAAVRNRDIRLTDLVAGCLDREEATRDLVAFSDVYRDKALAAAAAHQTLLENGYDFGPLHGMPIAVKANIAVKDEPMTAGSDILKDHRAVADADVAHRLKRAGAIIIGATNMHEFAWGGTTANPHFGQCRNPWDKARIPAGSSGGSGAAVAAGSALAALGTDTGGSVRLPASMNGVTGLRPSVGQISTKGVFPLAWSMDTVGPLARSAADCQAIFDALARRETTAQPLRSLRGARIGLIDGYGFENLQPDIETAFRGLVKTIEDMGANVETIRIDGLEVAVDAQVIVDAAEPSAVHAPWLADRATQYGEDVRILLHAGMTFTAVEYLQAQRYRTYLRDQIDRHLEKVNVLLMPTLPFTAPLIGQETIMIGDLEESTLTGNMRFTCIPSLSALPAISFPIGVDRLNLPIGAQLMGGEGSETQLMTFVSEFQAMSVFHTLRP
jgi:aspartyl-tRNA(Asn)/glutamyl-tRNA(Gln) amidotransferase subunit A